MLRDLLMALGLMALLEGLALALAPSAYERLLEALRSMSAEERRSLALGVIALGVALLWIASGL